MHSTPCNSVVRLIAINAGIGVVIGFGCAAALLVFDYQGIRSLMQATDAAVPALVLLFAGFSVTFGSVVSGSAIMALGRRLTDDDGSGRGRFATRLSPIHASVVNTNKAIKGRQ
jgi:hypothetical protein